MRYASLALVNLDPMASMCYCCAGSGETEHFYKEPSYSPSPGWGVHMSLGGAPPLAQSCSLEAQVGWAAMVTYRDTLVHLQVLLPLCRFSC